MRFWDAWARHHRRAEALGAAIILLVASAWFVGARWQRGRDPVVDRGREGGVVILRPEQPMGLVFATIVTAGGDTLGLIVPEPAPAVGDSVPLTYTEHRSGKRVYAFDQVGYLTGEGGW
jgi:hypothetical protein